MAKGRVAIIHSLPLFSEAISSLVRERGGEVVAVEPADPGSFERVRRAGADAVILVAAQDRVNEIAREVGLDSLDDLLVLALDPQTNAISVYSKRSILDPGADDLASLLRSAHTLAGATGLSESGGEAAEIDR